ncbi:MAG: CvpA family protein [Rikenellaceae bacterium]
MNWIDIVILLLLAFALYSGAVRGVIVQLCSILGVILGIWLGVRYGEVIGCLIGVTSDYAFAVGLSIVVIATVVALAVVARLFRGLFKFAGLGVLDRILGAALSGCKYALIISVLLGIFDTFNSNINLLDKSVISQSKLYRPMINISDSIFPALDWTKQQIDSGLEKLQ